MKNDKLNDKLSHCLDSKLQLRKNASLGNFSDIQDAQTSSEAAAMVTEMLSLDKYQSIITDLKSASGIVNFVTNEEYGPLVELLLRKAFPASENTLFTAGHPDPDESFINPEYFAEKAVPNLPQDVKSSVRSLQDLLFGSEVLITPQWLKEKREYSDDQVTALLGERPSRPSEMPSRGERAYRLGDEIEAINARYDSYINDYKSKINRSLLDESSQTPGGRSFSPEDLKKRKAERDRWRRDRNDFLAMKKSDMDILKSRAGDLAFTKFFKGSLRNNDGFINFDQADSDIIQSLEELCKSVTAATKIASDPNIKNKYLRMIDALRTKLREFTTSNTELTTLKNDILNFLSTPDGSSQDNVVLDKIIRNAKGKMIVFYQEFIRLSNRQNKVLILDDFQRSALCNSVQAGPKEPQKIHLSQAANSILKAFSDTNDSGLIRDDSRGTQKFGNRILVIVSPEPIEGMSYKKVTMSVSPVDPKEAEIIVRHLMKSPIANAQKSLAIKLYNELSESTDPKDPEYNNKLQQNKNIVGKFSSEVFDEELKIVMIESIIGLGQKDAINSTREAIFKGVKREGAYLSIDVPKIAKGLTEIIDNSLSDKVQGIEAVPHVVTFQDYITRTISDWTKVVGRVKTYSDDLIKSRTFITQGKEKIRQLQKEIDDFNKIPEKSRNDAAKQANAEKELLLNTISEQIKSAQQDIKVTTGNMPHVYVLYGKPGVGKSIWAQALASLFTPALKIRSVDIASQKSGLYGSTEQNCNRLFKYMTVGRRTVFLIDELDRQVEQGDSANNPNNHEITKEILNMFLSFFESTQNEQNWRDNDLFFVITTNNVNSIDTALFSRAPEIHEVMPPDTPEAYEKFFRMNFEVERKKKGEVPWFRKPTDKTPEEGWESTMEIINSLNWKDISKYFASRETGFRALKNMLQQALQAHWHWRIDMQNIEQGNFLDNNGKIKIPGGMPFTNSNLVAIAHEINADNVGDNGEVRNDEYCLGVNTVCRAKDEQLRALLKPLLEGNAKIETKVIKDPMTNKDITVPKLPDDILNKMKVILDGQETTKENIEESNMIPEEVVGPDGKKRTILRPKTDEEKKKTPQQKMKELVDKSLQTKPAYEEPKVEPMNIKQQDIEKIDKENKENKENKEKVDKNKDKNKTSKDPMKSASSTDYIYNFLIKEGILKQPEIIEATETNTIKPKKVKKTEEENGVYAFSKGFLMVAPRWSNVAPQKIATEEAKIINKR